MKVAQSASEENSLNIVFIVLFVISVVIIFVLVVIIIYLVIKQKKSCNSLTK